MKKFSFFFLLFLFSVQFFAAQGRSPFPDKIDYVNIIGRDCTAYFNAAAPDFFLRQAADNLNYPLFRWTSDKQTDARYPGYSNSPELSLFGVKVVEMIVRFKEDMLDEIYTVFYSRGDTKTPLSKYEFEKLRKTIGGKLKEYTGDPGKERNGSLTKYDRLTSWIFVKENQFSFELKSSIRKKDGRESGEYIHLLIRRFDRDNDPRMKSLTRSGTTARKITLRENIRQDKNGDVWLDNIPMVDQGMKGYCVPAVMERVLRYYGNEQVTQHTLAQIAETEAAKGTSVDFMVGVVQRTGKKFGIRLSSLYQRVGEGDDLEKLVKDYNKAARRMKEPEIRVVTQKQGRVTYLMVGETLDQMKPEVEAGLWKSRKGEYNRFLKTIRENIDKGIPVVWSVQLGKFPEEKLDRQSSGGHMRLISGYNEKEKTVIYTDTWGGGHEKKTMSADQAWTITTAYFTLKP